MPTDRNRCGPENLCLIGLLLLTALVNSRRGVVWGLVGALLSGCAQAPLPAPTLLDLDRVMTTETFDPAQLSRAIFEESNRVRIEHGLPALRHLDALDAAAGEQATYLELSHTVGHQNPFPDEHDIGQRITHVGLASSHATENAIRMPARRPDDEAVRDYTYAEYAAFLLEGWMNSPGHRANLLDPHVNCLGCAARISHGIVPGDPTVYATQVFYAKAEKEVFSVKGG